MANIRQPRGSGAGDPAFWNELHADVSRRLDGILHTMNIATDLGLAWSKDTIDAKDALRQLESDLVSVRQLELRMPIVAPMKAGKSTIINAIVGYDLLPARAEAMTTLPTKIILVEGLSEPELTICDEDARLFADLAMSLQAQVRARFNQLADRYAHLENLLTQIRDGQLRSIDKFWSGRHPVLEGLTQLNDLLRLAAILRPEDDFIGRLAELPTLRTPFWMRPELAGTESAGTLAMVDTPGPDEAGVAARLVGAVATQLKSCHVVLLLFDYTAMGRITDEEIRNLIEPVVQQIGREKLYVVVNKVDQRRPGDRDTDGVRRYVQRDLDLVDGEAGQRIFETKGQQALSAARVISQYSKSDGSDGIRDTKEVQALLRELFSAPEDRQQALANWTEDYLLGRAEGVWGASGLPTLLTHAIGRLRTYAVPVVLTSALDKAEPQLTSLRDVASLRLKAARTDRQRVESELKVLKQERRLLDQAWEEAPDAAKFGRQIEERLRAKLESFSYFGRGLIDNLDRDVRNFAEARERSRSYADDGLISKLWNLVVAPFTEPFRAAMGGQRERSDGIYEFDTAEEATEFIQQITAMVLGSLRRAADATREDLNSSVSGLAAEVVAEQDRKVRPIIERASRRLSEAFDLTLTVPPLRLTDSDIEVESPLPQLEESRQRKTRTRTEMVRRWYTLWLVKVPVTVTETYDEVTRVHLVDLQALKEQLAAGFDIRQGEVSEEIKSYTVDNLMRELERYFTGVDAYLRGYTQSLEQAQADASHDEAGKAEIARSLNDLVNEAEDHLAAAAALKARLA